jgi:hypothetical protein
MYMIPLFSDIYWHMMIFIRVKTRDKCAKFAFGEAKFACCEPKFACWRGRERGRFAGEDGKNYYRAKNRRGNWFAVSALFYASRLYWLTRASSAFSENSEAAAQADLSALKVFYRRIADPAGREVVRSGRFLELHAKPRSRKDL